MANILFANNASSLLAATIVPADLTIQVKPGFGALFPDPSSPQIFYITLEDDSGNIEVMKCTSRSVDLLTVVRGQDGTVAQDFVLDVTRVELRVQAIVLGEFVQVNGDAMAGDLDFVTNEIQNAYLTGTTRITGGQTIGTAIRGTLDQSNNELAVPAASGVRATAGGVPIVVDTDDIIALLDTAGVIDLASATIGVKIGTAGASDYLRLYGGGAEYVQFAHDATDLLITANATGKISIDNLDVEIIGGTLTLADKQLIRPEFLDFAVTRQAVSGITTTTVDYQLGQYVEIAMTANIVTFSITDFPSQTPDVYGVIRLKFVQGASPWTITWPAAYKWPGSVAPVLSTGNGDIDFIDLWTDDKGVTWYGSYAQLYS